MTSPYLEQPTRTIAQAKADDWANRLRNAAYLGIYIEQDGDRWFALKNDKHGDAGIVGELHGYATRHEAECEAITEAQRMEIG